MCLWGPRRGDLVALVQRRMDTAPKDDDRNWLMGLEVAMGVVAMEAALKAAGLADGVEPDRTGAELAATLAAADEVVARITDEHIKWRLDQIKRLES
jgi:hypothetical protein